MDRNSKRKKTIRVLQIFDYYLPLASGAANRHNELAEYLRPEIDIKVLTRRWGGTKAKESVNGTMVFRVSHGASDKRLIQQVFAGLAFCRELWIHHTKYDILHSFSPHPFYIPVYIVAKLFGKPVIIEYTLMEANNKSTKTKILETIANVYLRQLDAFITISTPLLEKLIYKGFPSEKCYRIIVGVDTDVFTPVSRLERMQIRSHFGLENNNLYVIFLGSFIKRKGADILVEMMIRLSQSCPEVHLIIVGRNEFPSSKSAQIYSMTLKERLIDSGQMEKVHFIDHVSYSEVPAWLQASDVFVFPSRREGLGRVILEAMAVGLPCVCAEMNGIAYDMISPGENGVVVKEEDPELWSLELRQLIHNKVMRKRLGKNARTTVLEGFDQSKTVRQYQELYELLAQEG